MSVDSIANFLTIIRNGIMVRKRSVVLSSSKMRVNIAQVLKSEGYIRDYKVENNDGPGSSLTILLKYVNGSSAINEITRVSRPSRRHYQGASEIVPVIGGLGIAIVTTSSGVVTDRDARRLGIGGEILCHVW
ncbi:30S ribosomal protein S8 [Candidatus Babeliales bacterium]|nr:30S ribosomal protein S8 [Candidatus Babeliales bacterium]